MSEAQPPAGWYPDPQDAQQQRYWDGATWTGHTAAAAEAVATPTGTAPQGAAIPTGAPSWQMPMMGDAGAPKAKKPWFRRTWVIVTAAVIVVLVVLGVVFGSGGDHSNALEKAILKDGQQQLQTSIDQNVPGAKAKITSVDCVEDRGHPAVQLPRPLHADQPGRHADGEAGPERDGVLRQQDLLPLPLAGHGRTVQGQQMILARPTTKQVVQS
jgi:hypothetical protein